MQESVCNFGPENGLLGILTTPDGELKKDDAPIALILNAGIVHRVGPFRMNVDIARALAARGFSAMRIDLSGLGDSAPRTGKLASENRAELDVSDAMEFLTEETGVEEFVLLGLCSGACNAHKVSVKDERIVGSVFMDGIVFRTVGYYLRQHFVRYMRPRFWRNAIKRRLIQTDSNSEGSGQSLAESEFFNADALTVDGVVKDLNKLLGRGVQMLFLYTHGYDDICGRSQFKEMYGFQPDNEQLQVEYYPKSEHTFRLIENRKAVCERVSDWFENRFGQVSESAGHSPVAH